MTDPRVSKLADLLVNYSVAIQPGQKVLIRGNVLGAPLIREIYQKVLQAGGLPFVIANLPELDEVFYRFASEEQLKFIPEPFKIAMETFDAQIQVIASGNTRALSSQDPAKSVIRDRAFEPVLRTLLDRASRGLLKWTLTLYPTEAYAQEADMSLTDYEDFVYQACMPDMADPAGYWRNISAKQSKIVDWLKGKETIHIVGPDTDLTMSVAGRKFINCDCHENVPDGEVFTGPVENSMNGHVRFSYPAIMGGRQVTGVQLWFQDGRVVKACADKNEEYLLKTIDTDEGARQVGEFAIGTNEGIDRFTGEILFDEKIGGSFHMALGAGYPETGSVNQSAIHWDMICDLRDGGEIQVDGEKFYQDGQFVVDL